MGAPKGNEFWKKRIKSGRNRTYENVDELEKECLNYFEDVVDTPIEIGVHSFFKGGLSKGDVHKRRGMSIYGLCVHLGVSISTWKVWRADEKRKDLLTVINWAEGVIKAWNLEGAMAEQLNPNLVARIEGIGDKQQIEADIKQTKQVIKIGDQEFEI